MQVFVLFDSLLLNLLVALDIIYIVCLLYFFSTERCSEHTKYNNFKPRNWSFFLEKTKQNKNQQLPVSSFFPFWQRHLPLVAPASTVANAWQCLLHSKDVGSLMAFQTQDLLLLCGQCHPQWTIRNSRAFHWKIGINDFFSLCTLQI